MVNLGVTLSLGEQRKKYTGVGLMQEHTDIY